MARGQRVYGKSHPTRESIDLNLPALSSRDTTPSAPPLPGRSNFKVGTRGGVENFRRTSGEVLKSSAGVGSRSVSKEERRVESAAVESRMIANRRKKKKGERERKERREEGEEGGKRDAVSPRRGGAPTPVTSPGERWQRRLNALVLKRARGRERGKSAEGRRRRGAWRKGTVAREEQQEDERGGEDVRGTESGWRRRKRKEEAREDRDGGAKERGREGERRRARRGVAMEGLGGGAGEQGRGKGMNGNRGETRGRDG